MGSKGTSASRERQSHARRQDRPRLWRMRCCIRAIRSGCSCTSPQSSRQSGPARIKESRRRRNRLMARHWTFTQQLRAGFALTVALSIAMGVVAIVALQSVVSAKDHVISVNSQNLIDTQKLALLSARESVAIRGFLLDTAESNLVELSQQRNDFKSALGQLRGRV